MKVLKKVLIGIVSLIIVFVFYVAYTVESNSPPVQQKTYAEKKQQVLDDMNMPVIIVADNLYNDCIVKMKKFKTGKKFCMDQKNIFLGQNLKTDVTYLEFVGKVRN